MSRISEIWKRLAATAGRPWSHGYTDGGCTDMAAVAGEEGRLLVDIWGDHSAKNAEFIAHAPEDIEWLLSEVQRLTAERDQNAVDLVAAQDAADHYQAEAKAEKLRAKQAAQVLSEHEDYDDYWKNIQKRIGRALDILEGVEEL